MRILGCEPGPSFSVLDMHLGWMRALKNAGHDVQSVNLGDRLDSLAGSHVKKKGRWVKTFPDIGVVKIVSKTFQGDVLEFAPDVVFLTSCFFVPMDTLDLFRNRGIKVVIAHSEAPYEQDAQVDRAQHADVNLVNDTVGLDLYPRAVYQPHCYDPAVHYKRPIKSPDHVSDFCFVGTAYPSRIEFLEAVDWSGVDVCLAGNWNRLTKDSPLRKYVAHDIADCLDNDDAVDLYAATKVSANLYRTEAQRPALSEGWSMGPRELELAACGVPFVRDGRRTGEADEVLSMLPTFTTPQEFGDELRGLLASDLQRDLIVDAAYDAIKDRTFDAAAARLLTLL